MGAIVTVTGAGTSERDFTINTILIQVLADEFGTVIRIDTNDGEREHARVML